MQLNGTRLEIKELEISSHGPERQQRFSVVFAWL